MNMHSKLSFSTPFLPRIPVRHHNHQALCRFVCCAKPPSENKLFKLLSDNKWRLNDFDTSAMQGTLNQWLSNTQVFLTEATSPLVKNVQDRKSDVSNSFNTEDVEEVFMAEQTIDSRTPGGDLSLAAIVSIEQFSRMNGLTGKKMQRIFKALVPESVYSDARNMVEYGCFRFLSRDSSEIHPCLKELAFRRLLFVTMLGWERPYKNGEGSGSIASEKFSLQGKLVGEKAFVRIAPAISGLADRPTAHSLFKALAGPEQGISFVVWSTYIDELIKVHEGRKAYQSDESVQFSGERILCLGSSRKRPILKWENNMAWPGKLTLTDKALYFEAVGLRGQRYTFRMDLTRRDSRVEKARVGPLGSDLFDSAIAITSGPEAKRLVLEFVDLGSEMRRDVWHAFIHEVISLHKFIRHFGPKDGDQSLYHVYGAQKGKERATTYAINGIARLQALQFMRRLLDEPTKLVQFSYLQNAPYGEVVCQTLAVNCWGGPLVTNFTGQGSSDELMESGNHVSDIDGSVYLRKWMRHPSWASSASIVFWRNSSVKQAVVLSKNLVVADMTLVEKAATLCREKYQEVEKTQATINAATIEGIPSNIDLFKELLLPLTATAKNFDKLRRWEKPHRTASFLAFVYVLIFRNMLPYVFPTMLMASAVAMLLLKGLKEQGRLGRTFGKVTIRDQPPSNTIEKLIAVKEAMREMEKHLQNLNVSLLKIRTIILAGQPQITMEVALVLLLSSAALFIIPFKFILSLLIFDLFTRELEFRRQMVMRFMSFLKERWDSVPALPVAVLPYESDDNSHKKKIDDSRNSERTQISSKSK